MSAEWRCAVCEGVNDGGRTCTTCGAVVGWRDIVATAAREELSARTGLRPGERAVRALLRKALDRALSDRRASR